MNLGSSVVEALSEGGTLAVVFLAVEVLAEPEGSRFNWSTHPLLALAVLLQGLQSLSRLANTESVGYFAAECRARVTARIHSQVLRLSFPCGSGTKVGDLTDYASQGPEAIRIQIEQSGQLLVLLLLSSTVLAVLVGISPWASRSPSLIEPLSLLPSTELYAHQAPHKLQPARQTTRLHDEASFPSPPCPTG